MIRRYCDGCGELVEKDYAHRNAVCRLAGETSLNGGKIGMEVVTSFDGTWNAGDFCNECLIKAFIKMFVRPAKTKKGGK